MARLGRLLAAVLCKPSMFGFGLDEDTAFALGGNDQLSVVGRGSLTIVDDSQLEATDVDKVAMNAPAAFTGMRMHVLTAGWTYDLANRRCGKRPALEAPMP